jgi:hypothetical protein
MENVFYVKTYFIIKYTYSPLYEADELHTRHGLKEPHYLYFIIAN